MHLGVSVQELGRCRPTRRSSRRTRAALRRGGSLVRCAHSARLSAGVRAQEKMSRSLRIAAAAYAIVAAGGVVFSFVSHPTYAPEAMAYADWYYQQPRGAVAGAFSTLSFLLVVISFLSAASLTFAQRWARWPFTVSFVLALSLDVLLIGLGEGPPRLMDSTDISLLQVLTVLGGAVLGLLASSRTSEQNLAL